MVLGLVLLGGWVIFKGLEAAYEAGKKDGRLSGPTPIYSPPPPALPPGRLSLPVLHGRTPTGKTFSSARELFDKEYVSFTRIDTFAKCPRKFQLSYLNGYRQEERDLGGAAKAGNDFHARMELLFRRCVGKRLRDMLHEPEVNEDPKIAQVVKSENPDSVVLASELELRFRADDREFLGYVDVAVERPDGVVALIDAKTGYRNNRFQPDPIQMDIYSLPELILRPGRRVALSMVFVDGGYTKAWINGPENRSEVIARVKSRVEAIERATDFQANRGGLCDYCHVRDLCEANPVSIYRQIARR